MRASLAQLCVAAVAAVCLLHAVRVHVTPGLRSDNDGGSRRHIATGAGDRDDNSDPALDAVDWGTLTRSLVSESTRSSVADWSHRFKEPYARTMDNAKLTAVERTTHVFYPAGTSNTMWRKLFYSGFETCFGPSTQGAGTKTHLKTHLKSRFCAILKKRGAMIFAGGGDVFTALAVHPAAEGYIIAAADPVFGSDKSGSTPMHPWAKNASLVAEARDAASSIIRLSHSGGSVNKPN